MPIAFDWMGCGRIAGDDWANAVNQQVVQASNGPYAAGSTPVYTAQIVDAFGAGVPASRITVLTLSIVDTLSGAEILAQTNILNVGRGAVDASGNLTISLLASDTALTEAPGATSLQRSMVIDFTYTPGPVTGRHQVNFTLLALAGA